jgi:hypothetical protein
MLQMDEHTYLNQAITLPKATSATGVVQRSCGCGQHVNGGECSECRRKRKGNLQRAAVGSSVPDVPQSVHEALRAPGHSLDPQTRSFMEPRLGFDLSRVRVHTDAKAAQSAQDIDALAYTLGRDIVFAPAQYAPGSPAGRRVIAHELAHVMQQAVTSPSTELRLGEADTPQEREAEALASSFAGPEAGEAVLHPPSESGRAGVVQRIGPAGAAAAGAAVGLAAGIISFALALEYAQSLATRYPGWLNTLPNCPCRESDVVADPGTWGRDRNPLLGWFHPGAASSYRSNAAYASVPGSAHGQQCTYDSTGNLLTEGPGAGTPDSWSPNTNGGNHFLYDVATWQVLGWRIYNQYWQPNNGNGCAANRGENTFMRRLSEFLP